MKYRVIDTVLPEPKTELEEWRRWLNKMYTSNVQLRKRKKIEVEYCE